MKLILRVDEWRPVKRLINDRNAIAMFHKNVLAIVYTIMPRGARLLNYIYD